MSELQAASAIKQEDQKEEEAPVNNGNAISPPLETKISARSNQQASVLSKRSTLSIDEIIGVGHDRRVERSGSRIKQVDQAARGSNADIETVIEEAYPSLQVQVTSKSARNRKSPSGSNKSGPSESRLSRKTKKQQSKVQVSGSGVPQSQRDSQTNANINSKSGDKSHHEQHDQLQETSRSSYVQPQPQATSPFQTKAPIMVKDFKTVISRAQANQVQPQQNLQDLQMMSQKDYQIYLKNKLTWNSSHVNKTFSKIPNASGKSTERSYRDSIDMVRGSQDSVRIRANNDSLLSNKKESSVEKANQSTVNSLPLDKIVKDANKAQYSHRGPRGGQDMINPTSNGGYPSTLGRSATNDISPYVTQSSVAKPTGSEVVDENQTNKTMVRQSISPGGHTQLTVHQQYPVPNIQAFVGLKSQHSHGFDDPIPQGSISDNVPEHSNIKNPFSTIQTSHPSSKAVEDNFKEFNKFAKLLPIDRLDSNQKTLVLTHLALESQRSQLVGRNRILNEVMRGQFDQDATHNMNEILQKHNNDELALENYVKKRIAQPKSFVEVAKNRDHYSIARGQVKTQGAMGSTSGTQANSIQVQRMYSQGKPEFRFKPKLSLYATNNSFTTAVPTQRTKANQLSYRLQLQTPKSNFISGEQSCAVPVGLTMPSLTGTTAVNSPASQVAARQILKQNDLKSAAEASGAAGLGASLSSQYRRNKGQQASSFKDNQYHKKYDISGATPLMDELLMTRAGSKKMCQRELRNMQKVMLKAKIANKPKYLWGPTDLAMNQQHHLQYPATANNSGPISGIRRFAPDDQDGQEALRNLAFSDRTKDSLYQVEDSARSSGPGHPTATNETSTPVMAARTNDLKQKVLSQQQELRGNQPLSEDHAAQLRTAKNADLGGLDPKLSHLARDWGFHQDPATLGSIMSDKTHQSKAFQGSPRDNIAPSDMLGPSINLKMLRAIDEKDPANISYMCMQMKQKFIEEKRLKTQKNKVRALADKLEKYKKENNHILVRRDYQYKTVTYKNKWDLMLPNDDVYNGGYSRKYQLLQNPNVMAQQFKKQMSQNMKSEKDKLAYQSMEHPAHLTETERIIRYEAAKMANAGDLEKIPGSTFEQASALDAMYENYFDASKSENIEEFGLMKTVDKCLETRLNRSRQGQNQPEDKLYLMAKDIEKSRAFQKVGGIAANTNQMLISALHSQFNNSTHEENSSQKHHMPTKGDASFEYSDAEVSQQNMMTALLPPGSTGESNAQMFCYYRKTDSKSPNSPRMPNQGMGQKMSPRLAGAKKRNITIKDHRDQVKKDSSDGTQERAFKTSVNEKTGESKRETSLTASKGEHTQASHSKSSPAERIVALARHRHLVQPEPTQGKTDAEQGKPSSAGKSETGSPSTEYKARGMAPPVPGTTFNQSLYSFKKAENERPGALAIEARQIQKPGEKPSDKNRMGRAQTMAMNNGGAESSPEGRNPNIEMQHYLSHGGKESTLYGEAVSSASKPASHPKHTGMSPSAQGEGTRDHGQQAGSDIGFQKKDLTAQRATGRFAGQARNTQSSQSPRPTHLVPTKAEAYAQIKDLQRPLLMASPPAPSNALSHHQNASGHFGGGSFAQSQMIPQPNSGTTSPGFGPASLKKCYLIKPNESSSQRQNNTMVGKSVIDKRLQEAKDKQERLERQQRSKKSSVGAQGRESLKALSGQGVSIPHDWNGHQNGLVGERIGSGGVLHTEAEIASGSNQLEKNAVNSNIGSCIAIGSPMATIKDQQEDTQQKEWGQLGLKTYEMQVLLSTSGSRTSQKHDQTGIQKEASQGSGSQILNTKGSKSKKDNSVNVYPPGQGRASPTLATPISKGEQSLAQAGGDDAANENKQERQSTIVDSQIAKDLDNN